MMEYEHFFYSERQAEILFNQKRRPCICELENGEKIQYTEWVTSKSRKSPKNPNKFDDTKYLGIGKFSHLA